MLKSYSKIYSINTIWRNFGVFYKVLWRCFHGSPDIRLHGLYTRLGFIRVRMEVYVDKSRGPENCSVSYRSFIVYSDVLWGQEGKKLSRKLKEIVKFQLGKTKNWENYVKRNMEQIRVKKDSAGKYSSIDDVTYTVSSNSECRRTDLRVWFTDVYE
jgi:hypothetical protein